MTDHPHTPKANPENPLAQASTRLAADVDRMIAYLERRDLNTFLGALRAEKFEGERMNGEHEGGDE